MMLNRTFGPNALASYSVNATNKIVFNKVGERLFDLVIMMDCALCPIHAQLSTTFHEYVKKHSETIRKHGAVPVLFMSWASAEQPEMTAQLSRQYTEAGNEVHALVIPAGLAFAKSISHRPRLDLYASDGRHPGPLGT